MRLALIKFMYGVKFNYNSFWVTYQLLIGGEEDDGREKCFSSENSKFVERKESGGNFFWVDLDFHCLGPPTK